MGLYDKILARIPKEEKDRYELELAEEFVDNKIIPSNVWDSFNKEHYLKIIKYRQTK